MTDLARALQEPWPDLRLQRQGVGLGMWIFLASEVLFFSGLFITYAVYRSFNAEAFRIAGAHTQIIYGAINTALAEPVAKARLADLGVEPMRMTPAQFAQFITDEDKKWGKVIRDAGIKLD